MKSPRAMKSALLIALAAFGTAHASVVSWNLDFNGTLASSAVAGVIPVANWNNSWPSDPRVDLVDADGTATTLDLNYGSFNNWRMLDSDPGIDGDGTHNKRLLNGYLSAGPAGWNPFTTESFITLSQIPYGNYQVIVYFSSDEPGREGQLTDGDATYYFSTLGNSSVAGANATLTQTESTSNLDYAGANYAIFSGLSGDSLTITLQMRDDDEWGGIAGFQVVAVPEPSTALLGALGLFGLLRRRRA